jgi:hypothetical protein
MLVSRVRSVASLEAAIADLRIFILLLLLMLMLL